MDREIDAGTRRRRQLARWTVAGAVVVALVAAASWGMGLLRPSIRRAMVQTAVVDVGPVDASLSATGVVVPEIEQVISSPVDARLLRVLKRAGTPVKRGEALVALDVNASVLAVDQLDQDLALKTNQQSRSKLALDNTLSELSAQVEIKKLQLESATLEHDRNAQLFRQGLQSQQLVRTAEVAERQARIELDRLEASRQNAQAATRAELDGLALEMSKLRKGREEARRVLELATPRADRDGVVTWTLTDEGAAVRKGDVIARLADLRTFRVDASVSDTYASRLSVGQPVQVRVDDRALDGKVSDVLPTVQNGVITVRVALTDPSSSGLRSNLRVEVFVITGHRDRALRVRKGSSTSGDGAQQVFVIRGDHADRVRVTFGLSSFDRVEVTDGLAAGDEVIVSDMADYLHLTSIRLR